MTLNELRDLIPDFGRDIRLNLETVLNVEGAPGLTATQLWGSALACAYSLASKELVQVVLAEAKEALDPATQEAARSAATIMAMNNVYYRSTHLLGDEELKKMPARLRMNVIGKPGIPKLDFELMSFAVSALAGCGQCLTAHLHEIRKAGMATEGVHSVLRVASVLSAADQVLRIREL